MSGKQRMKRPEPVKKTKASHGEINEVLCFWQDECAPHEVTLRTWSIEQIRSCMADLKTHWADVRTRTRAHECGRYDPSEWLAHKGAIWALQIEINRHNAFMKRQGSFAF